MVFAGEKVITPEDFNPTADKSCHGLRVGEAGDTRAWLWRVHVLKYTDAKTLIVRVTWDASSDPTAGDADRGAGVQLRHLSRSSLDSDEHKRLDLWRTYSAPEHGLPAVHQMWELEPVAGREGVFYIKTHNKSGEKNFYLCEVVVARFF